ncbi:MAG: cell division protein FtsQ/DivIB [Thioalkalivibrionaceae bacterium]
MRRERFGRAAHYADSGSDSRPRRGAVRRVPAAERRAQWLMHGTQVFGAGSWALIGVAFGVAIVAGWSAWTTGAYRSFDPDAQAYVIASRAPLVEISADVLVQRLEPVVDGFFATDLAAVRRRALSEPWVADADVRRVWPGRIEVAVVERWPVARWRDDALIDRFGRAFGPVDQSRYAGLPALSGPDGSEASMVQRFLFVSSQLGDAGLEVVGIRQSERGAWTIELTGGVEIAMGRDLDLKRVERIAALWPRLQTLRADARPVRVDLRYAHGAAVAFAARKDDESSSKE